MMKPSSNSRVCEGVGDCHILTGNSSRVSVVVPWLFRTQGNKPECKQLFYGYQLAQCSGYSAREHNLSALKEIFIAAFKMSSVDFVAEPIHTVGVPSHPLKPSLWCGSFSEKLISLPEFFVDLSFL
ncbi:hypothetical protein AVEN_146635-1 [Araneus ventricosus]|uniref:Uncharacterized protein n=1 Tax=Araneus ventricosus TaxID=182803 RepID=A0A4Y2JF51_ARAVE|nr:hypothetical protein AVEN_146635-1 [Araneus ventricosus]